MIKNVRNLLTLYSDLEYSKMIHLHPEGQLHDGGAYSRWQYLYQLMHSPVGPDVLYILYYIPSPPHTPSVHYVIELNYRIQQLLEAAASQRTSKTCLPLRCVLPKIFLHLRVMQPRFQFTVQGWPLHCMCNDIQCSAVNTENFNLL